MGAQVDLNGTAQFKEHAVVLHEWGEMQLRTGGFVTVLQIEGATVVRIQDPQQKEMILPTEHIAAIVPVDAAKANKIGFDSEVTEAATRTTRTHL